MLPAVVAAQAVQNMDKRDKTALYVVGGVALLAVGFVGYKVYKKITGSRTDTKNRDMASNLRDYEVNASQATINSTQAMNIAQNLFDSMNRIGTNYPIIKRNLASLKNYHDLGMVIVAFGVKNYGSTGENNGWFARKLGTTTPLNLNGWLIEELDKKQLEEVVQIYNKLGWRL